MIDIFNIFKRKKRDTYKGYLMDDYGKPEVYGPWIRDEDGNIPGEFKWYKSYWFISIEGEPSIDLLPPYDESDINS